MRQKQNATCCIRVAFLIDTIARDTAGTERQLIRTVTRLDGTGVEPYVICLRRSPWIECNAPRFPVKVLEFSGFLKLGFRRVLSELRRYIEQEKIAIVHVFFTESVFVGYLAWLSGRNAPILVSSRRDIGLGDEPWYHRIYDLLLPLVNRRYSAVVANSRNVMRHVIAKERLPMEKAQVIYNGAEAVVAEGAEVFRRSSDARVVRVGISASLKPVKRVDLFLDAFRRLRGSIEGVRIEGVVLGDGPEKDRLVAMAKHFGIDNEVTFLGEVPDVRPYLGCLDIGVSCSDREGLSNAILEYMASGLPVVATAVGGTPELIDGENGICVPPGDPGALASALGKLVVSPETRARMGRRSLQRVKNEFSWERNISELVALYRRLLSRRSVTGYEPPSVAGACYK